MAEEFYRRGAQYDAQYADHIDDVEFYQRTAQTCGGPVLELACGTGRIAIPLAESGHQVTGIDIEASMLATAKAKANKPVHFVKGDMRNFDLQQEFQLILLAFNSIAHLHTLEDLSACLDCVREHLSETGHFVVSMFNPDLQLLTRDPTQAVELFRYANPEADNEVVITESASYDRATQILTSNWNYVVGDETFETQLCLRIFYPEELRALLLHNGFTIRNRYGNFDGADFHSDSAHQIIVAGLASK